MLVIALATASPFRECGRHYSTRDRSLACAGGSRMAMNTYAAAMHGRGARAAGIRPRESHAAVQPGARPAAGIMAATQRHQDAR
jgi:hypothetical protein